MVVHMTLLTQMLIRIDGDYFVGISKDKSLFYDLVLSTISEGQSGKVLGEGRKKEVQSKARQESRQESRQERSSGPCCCSSSSGGCSTY